MLDEDHSADSDISLNAGFEVSDWNRTGQGCTAIKQLQADAE
jgi:hypothetical protein